MKNKRIFVFNNQVIVIEHKQEFSKFTALKRIIINKNESK